MAANSWKRQAPPLPCPHQGTYLELYTHSRAMRACLWLAGFQRDEQRRAACALLNRLEGVWGGTTDDERRAARSGVKA